MKLIKDNNNKKRYVADNMPFIAFDKDFVTSKVMIDENRLPLIMAYLKINSSLSGKIGLSINTLVKGIGYKPNPRETKINSKIINGLQKLQESKDIIINEGINYKAKKDTSVTDEEDIKKWEEKRSKSLDISKLSHNECFIIQINYHKEDNVFIPKGNYVILTEKEFTTITQTKTRRDTRTLLNVYLNIKKHINFDGVSSPLCYPAHRTLVRACNLSSIGTINNIVNELVSFGLLYTYNPGKYINKKGKYRNANSFYALEDGILKPEVCDNQMKDYYVMQGIEINNFIKEKEK